MISNTISWFYWALILRYQTTIIKWEAKGFNKKKKKNGNGKI